MTRLRESRSTRSAIRASCRCTVMVVARAETEIFLCVLTRAMAKPNTTMTMAAIMMMMMIKMAVFLSSLGALAPHRKKRESSGIRSALAAARMPYRQKTRSAPAERYGTCRDSPPVQFPLA